MSEGIGRGLMQLGAGLVVVGAVVWGLARLGFTLGRLPGDLHVEGEGWAVHVPLATSVVVSVVVTLLLGLLSRR